MPETAALLLPGAYRPALNMAIDQMLLESVDAGGPSVLRFYHWTQPTLSLGYFQSLRSRDSHTESRGLVAVRRATGGGAIVHHHELTYSLVTRLPSSSVGARAELYRGVHAAFAETLTAFGLDTSPHHQLRGALGDADAFLCFQRRTEQDLVARGYKLLGSAQRRGRHAILQHGSLLLRASPHAPQLPGIEDLSPPLPGIEDLSAAPVDVQKHVDVQKLVAQVTQRIANRYRWTFRALPLTPEQIARAEQIEQDRFAHPSWLAKR